MEWVDGVTLGAALARKRAEKAPVERAAAIALCMQIARALQRAYGPQQEEPLSILDEGHIMIRRDGSVKLLRAPSEQAEERELGVQLRAAQRLSELLGAQRSVHVADAFDAALRDARELSARSPHEALDRLVQATAGAYEQRLSYDFTRPLADLMSQLFRDPRLAAPPLHVGADIRARLGAPALARSSPAPAETRQVSGVATIPSETGAATRVAATILTVLLLIGTAIWLGVARHDDREANSDRSAQRP
jgi:hypothetical protein